MSDEDTAIRPFTIDIPEADLEDLRRRIATTRWPDELAGAGWYLGIPRDYLRELAEYWRTSYDWRAQERRINEFPQFTTVIDGQRIHFLHVRSPEPDALPLLMTHGWPGSIVEFLEIIGPLTDPTKYGASSLPAFHLVVPAIPGFGFSGPTTEPGWDTSRVAKAWAVLMARLGYDRYGVQGGDWGSVISRELGATEPDHVVGVHLNMLLSPAPRDAAALSELTEDEIERLGDLRRFNDEMAGYQKLQGTRPQTLSYALTDSPVGQLGWIVEKFKEWTDSERVPEDAVDRDQMLTNVMFYWLTGTAGSSARIYYEVRRGRTKPEPSSTPTGVAVFPKEIARPVRRLAEKSNNIVHWSEFDAGGHFAAMEQPDLLVGDIREFFLGRR